MQVAGATKAEKAGDDKSINFRPSPNFKHMKKYLKYKFGEAGCSTAPILDQDPTKEIDSKANINVSVQPPLPPDSPPDYPPNFVLKKEVIDEGYEKNDVQQQHQQQKQQPQQQQVDAAYETYKKPKPADAAENPKKIMCKDFVRGTCKRTPCNYSHKLDLSQLKGVYKFCRDFANGKCKRPVCFFVHATTFEKENFFRTGVLPPHTVSHLNDTAVMQPQPVPEAPAPSCMPMFSASNTTHPDYRTSCAPSIQQTNMLPPAQPPIDPNPFVFAVPQPPPPAPSPPKRDWNEVNAGSARDDDEIAHKKCINCRLSEIRYHQTKAKLESVEASTQIIKDNIAMLDQKKAKLMAILAMVLFKDMPN